MWVRKANKYYNNFIARLSRQKTARLIFYVITIDVIITIIFSYILFPSHTAGPEYESLIEGFFIAVLVGPFIETMLFQHLIIKNILKWGTTATLVSCLASAILFAISHYYSWQYILKTFISGLLFASLYLIISHKRQNPVLIVSIAHAIYNCIGLMVDILSNTL
jgi:uncharacterized protein